MFRVCSYDAELDQSDSGIDHSDEDLPQSDSICAQSDSEYVRRGNVVCWYRSHQPPCRMIAGVRHLQENAPR